MQNKLNSNKQKESDNLIYFQNLIPGQPESPFIDRFKKECLVGEEDEEEREKLLANQFPPVLSFTDKQKKKFYEEEAKNCQQFCCGSMTVTADPETGKPLLNSQDNYMLSTGSGKLYEGSAATIKNEMQQDIRQEPFGSANQEQAIGELNKFGKIVDQRGAPSESTQFQENSHLSPLKTKLKPENE